MKAKDRKAIEVLNAEIAMHIAREKELLEMFDAVYDKGDMDAYRKVVEDNTAEYEGLDDLIMKCRSEIRRIRDADLIARGYFHEMSLARANID